MSQQAHIGIAVIGAGRAGLIHARNIATGRVSGARLVALADPSRSALDLACKELNVTCGCLDYRQVLDHTQVDAVVVATPSVYHCQIALDAAAAGKHILCEKPMAMNVAECDRMIDASVEAKVKLQIGFMRRYDVDFTIAAQRIAVGEIGRVVMVRSHTYGPSIPKPWMYDIRKSNGPLSEVNSHDIDTVRWFSGSEFDELYAVAGNFRSPQACEAFPDFYDNVILTARLKNGGQGCIGGAQGVAYGYDARCEILGEKGLISVGGLAGSTTTTFTAAGSTRPVVRSWTNLFLEAYCAEDQDFVRCVAEDDLPRASGHDGRASVMVVNAGNKSIVERRPIRLTEEVSIP